MTPQPSTSAEQISLGDLHKLLVNRLNLDELQTLCLQLDVPWEHLGGDTLPAKARYLVEFMERRRKVEELAAKAEEFISSLSGSGPTLPRAGHSGQIRRLTLSDEVIEYLRPGQKNGDSDARSSD